MKKKSTVLVVFFLIAAIFLVSAQTEKKYVLKFGHVLTTQDPYHEAFLKMAEAVSVRTNGNLKVEVYPSAQLGVEEDILEQIRQGANIGWNTDAARLGMYVPAIAVINAPYFVDSLEEVKKLNTIPSVAAWKAELERTQGIKILSFMWVQGFRQMITNKPIRKLFRLRWLMAKCTRLCRQRRSMASNYPLLLPRAENSRKWRNMPARQSTSFS